MKDKLQSALNEISAALNLDGLELSSDNNVALSIDEVEIGISLLDEIGMVHLFAIIGDMPDVTGPELGKVLLSANHMAVMTAGASIGYDTEGNLITLNMCLPLAHLDGGTLAAALETVSNVTMGWRGNLPVLREIEAALEPAPPAENRSGDWLRM